VTNLRNRKSVERESNDRGPFVEDRIIDLSQAAARALGIIDRGTAKVNIEFIDDETACAQARNPNLRRGASRVAGIIKNDRRILPCNCTSHYNRW